MVISQFRQTRFFLRIIFFLAVAGFTTQGAVSQSSQLQVDYQVAIADLDKQLFHVTTEIKNIREPSLTLSLPTWTPGWYTIENYARNILRFKVTDAKGNWVQSVMTRKQTWRIDTTGQRDLKVEFDYQATVLALKELPRVNAFIEGEDIVYHNYVHLGIAVSTDRGLAVPVLRHVEKMSFARIESEIKRLANATRDGKLGLEELQGGTFSITNGGVFGSLLSTPILNPPQVAILGLHKIQDRAVPLNGQVVIRPMMYVALSYDHRIVDGREAVQFLVKIKEYIEDPGHLLLES